MVSRIADAAHVNAAAGGVADATKSARRAPLLVIMSFTLLGSRCSVPVHVRFKVHVLRNVRAGIEPEHERRSQK
jgi:hypothetical protein